MLFKIREAREQCGLTQAVLADKLGINGVTLSGYETGKHDPKSDTLARIASICGVSVDYLLGLEPQRENTVSEKAMALARIYDTLDSDGQELLDHVAAYASSRKKVPAGFRAVPVLGDAVLDGTVETREAARNEQLEMMTKVPTTVE